MKYLTVVQFPSINPAQIAFQNLISIKANHPQHLYDAVLVQHQTTNNRIQIKQTTNVPAAAAVGGGFWGLLIGAIFLMPVAGLALGTLTGVAAGTVSDLGLDDTFVKQVGDALNPGSAAIIMLSPQPLSDAYHQTFQSHPHQILETKFTRQHRQKLRQILQTD